MARDFVLASTQYFANTSAPVAVPPCSMACWAYHTTTGAVAAMVGITNTANLHMMQIDLLTDNTLRAIHRGATTSASASIGSLSPLNAWHHYGGVFGAANSRIAYYDGSASTTNTTDVGAPTLNRTNIGAQFRSDAPTGNNHMQGMLAEVAIWNAALTTAEMLMLSKGLSPLFVRAANLQIYAPLYYGVAATSNEPDLCGGLIFSQTNSPALAVHPRIIKHHRRGIRRFEPAAAVGGFQAAWARGANTILMPNRL